VHLKPRLSDLLQESNAARFCEDWRHANEQFVVKSIKRDDRNKHVTEDGVLIFNEVFYKIIKAVTCLESDLSKALLFFKNQHTRMLI
jgi:hypothetical protein